MGDELDYKMSYEILLAAIEKAEADLALARKRAEWALRVLAEHKTDPT